MQVLAAAAIHIEAGGPWYEMLGLRCGEAADGGGDVAVEAVLAFNVVTGRIDAASETVLAPVFAVLKGLLGAIEDAAAAPEEIFELIQYCVGISICLVQAAGLPNMMRSTMEPVEDFKGEMEAVGRLAQSYGTRSSGCCSRRVSFNSHDRDSAASHKQKLKYLLDAVLDGLTLHAVHALQAFEEVLRAKQGALPPRDMRGASSGRRTRKEQRGRGSGYHFGVGSASPGDVPLPTVPPPADDALSDEKEFGRFPAVFDDSGPVDGSLGSPPPPSSPERKLGFGYSPMPLMKLEDGAAVEGSRGSPSPPINPAGTRRDHLEPSESKERTALDTENATLAPTSVLPPRGASMSSKNTFSFH